MNKKKSNITSKIFVITVFSIIMVTAVFFVAYLGYKKEYKDALSRVNNGKVIVALNEIDRVLLAEEGILNYETSKSKANIDSLIDDLQKDKTATYKNDLKYIKIFYIIVLISIIAVYLTIYILMLRPFSKLESFAAEIAQGNLDKDLKYERVNLFGEFTWAFDHMRREIKKARQCEQEAVENNKTVIATLSHDIKTPIASIRAYCEALADNMDSSPERRNRYIDVITKKCDEVTKITNDMFIHSLHDLDKLVIKKEELEISKIIYETVDAMSGNSEDIVLGDIKECVLKGDSGRIEQVIENLINNARKYAPGNIYISTECEENYIINVKDSGKGIPPEDIPFIFDKFYRGKNHGDEPGAGLGLFIVKYVMEQMDGRVELANESDGLLVKLILKK